SAATAAFVPAKVATTVRAILIAKCLIFIADSS
ncbi:MAG: hypothetical protein ACI9I0_001263, partial [Rhodoferax sp.]